MKRIFLYSVILLGFGQFSFGQSQEHWINIGLENSPTGKVQEAKIKTAEQMAKTAFEWPETQIQVSAIEWMPNDLSPYFRPTVSLTQEIPWFGTEKSKRKLAESTVNLQKSSATNIQAELRQKIGYQYVELQYLEEKSKLLNDHFSQLEAIYDNLLVKLEAGQTAAWEVIILENEINTINSEIKKSEFIFNRQKEIFELLVGSEIKNIELDSLQLIPSEDLKTIEKHPLLDNLEAQKEELTASKDVLKIDYSPKLSVGIHYEAAMPVEPTYVTHDMLMPTLGLSFPLFANKRKAKKKYIEYQESGISAEIEEQKNLLQQELVTAKNNLFTYQTQMQMLEQNIQNTEDAIELMWREYEANKIGFQEITRIQEKKIQFSIEHLEALKEYNQVQVYLKYLSNHEQ